MKSIFWEWGIVWDERLNKVEIVDVCLFNWLGVICFLVILLREVEYIWKIYIFIIGNEFYYY